MRAQFAARRERLVKRAGRGLIIRQQFRGRLFFDGARFAGRGLGL